MQISIFRLKQLDMFFFCGALLQINQRQHGKREVYDTWLVDVWVIKGIMLFTIIGNYPSPNFFGSSQELTMIDHFLFKLEYTEIQKALQKKNNNHNHPTILYPYPASKRKHGNPTSPHGWRCCVAGRNLQSR